MTGQGPIVRPLALADFEGIRNVLKRTGMGDRSYQQWAGTWTEYPYASQFEDIPMGWVLETPDGEIAGTHSAVRGLYDFNGRTLRAVLAGDWAVDQAYRAHSLKLGAILYRQRLDLFINGSASRVAAQLMKVFRMKPTPSPDYDRHFLWAGSCVEFAESILLKRGVPFAGLAKYPLALAVWLRSQAGSSGFPACSEKCSLIEYFDERFDEFWRTLRNKPGVVRAFRDRATLHWRFRAAQTQGRLRVLAVLRNGAIYGYAILVRREKKHLGVSQYTVMDLQCLETDPEAIQALLRAAIDLTRRERVGYLEMIGFCEWKRGAARRLKPLIYTLPAWQTYYRVSDPALAPRLASPTHWDASPFDSD